MIVTTDAATRARLIAPRIVKLIEMRDHHDPNLRLNVPDAVVRALEAYRSRVQDIDAQPFIESEKDKRFAVARQETDTAIDLVAQQITEAATKPFDQEEGQARADAKARLAIDFQTTPAAVNEMLVRRVFEQERVQRTAVDLGLLAQTSDPLAIEMEFENTLLSDDPYRISRLGQAAVLRLEQLVAAKPRKPNANTYDLPAYTEDAVGESLRRVRAQYSAWRREHPTPAERIRQAQAARQAAATTATRELQKALRFVFQD